MRIKEMLRRLSDHLQGLLQGNLVIKVTSLIVALILVVALVSNLLLQSLSYQAIKENVRNNLVLVTSQAASTVDGEMLKTLDSPEDEGTSTYLELQKNLQKLQDASLGRIRYIYTLAKKGEKIVYVLDAVPIAEKENHSSLGEEFIVNDYSVVLQGFEKPTAEWEPTDDVIYGGMSQTGYGPITDSNGLVVGVLAIDIDASVIAQKKKSMNDASLIAWGISTLLAMMGGVMFARYLTDPVLKLKQGMKRVSEGHLDETLDFGRKDELGELANSFNAMVSDLREYNAELKRISREMIHQEKMAGIGQLSAGIAHEINNPLGYIKSNTSTLEVYLSKVEGAYLICRRLAEDYDTLSAEEREASIHELREYIRINKLDMLYEDFRDIVSESKIGLSKIAGIVKSLLGFARKAETTDFIPYDLNKGIEDTLVIANNEIKYFAEVTMELGEIPIINVIDGEINQVLLNLIINASYAVKETGKFGKINIRTYESNGSVFCEITDTGIGIGEETIKRIFEPFFTTKPVGVGTGLGLSMAYDSIVKKHSGTLTIQSKVGEGTTFVVGLPILREM